MNQSPWSRRAALRTAIPLMAALATGSGCIGEHGRALHPPAPLPMLLHGPRLQVVPSVPAGDLLRYPGGTVRLISIRLEPAPAKMATAPAGARIFPPARVGLELAGERAGRRALVFSGWRTQEEGGIRLAVEDEQAVELWSMGWEAGAGGRRRFFEAAPGVELQAEQVALPDGKVAESYRQRLGPLIRECRITYDPRSSADREAAMADFARFYIPGSALDDNPEGHLASRLVMDRRLVDWAAGRLQPSRPTSDRTELAADKNWFEALCAVAAACSLLKCGFAGLLNPVCDICGGIAFVCALAELFGWG